MVNEILGNGEQIVGKGLNTKNEDLTETLDEQRFREYIWKDFIAKHVKVEYGEKLGYQGKILRIELPVNGNFKGYKFEGFISDNSVEESQYDKKYENLSFSLDEIDNFNENIREYMKSYGIKRYRYSNEFYHIIYELFGKAQSFWLKDNVWYTNSSYISNFNQRSKNDPYQYHGNLLLKLS